MGTYILMTKMIPEISADLKRREAIEWSRFVEITREIGI